MERVDPPWDGDEAGQLIGFLDYQRATLAVKTGGLDAEQLARTLPPSTMTLGGMLKHLAFVEAYWHKYVLLGDPMPEPFGSAPFKEDPDWEWHTAHQDGPEELRGLWEREVADARAIVATRSMTDLAARERHGHVPNLRWILLHLVEEYARHLGHADLIRESIDGQTGD